MRWKLEFPSELKGLTGQKLVNALSCGSFRLGSGYFAVDGNLPSETILP